MNELFKTQHFLLAFDLDGTLLNSEKTISPKTAGLLKELALQGNRIVLASGRSLRQVRYYQEMLGLNGPIIAYNGAMIQCFEDPTFPTFMRTIPLSVFTDFYHRFEDHIVNYMVENLTDQYYLEENKDYVNFFHPEGMKIHLGKEDFPTGKNLNAVVLRVDDLSVKPAMLDTIGKLDNDLALRFWFNAPMFSEIYFRTTNKATALEKARNYYHIDREHMIAFGDAYNDLEMIRTAGISVAMKNGAPELKKAATYISEDDNDHEGIYLTLKKLLQL